MFGFFFADVLPEGEVHEDELERLLYEYLDRMNAGEMLEVRRRLWSRFEAPDYKPPMLPATCVPWL